MPQRRADVGMELPDVTNVLEETYMVIKQCLKQFKLNELFLSFNGGKDCTVLLDIALKILKEIYNRENIEKELKVVYIRTSGPFVEIEEFVKEVERYYDIKLIVVDGEMKYTLQRLLDQDNRLKACFMGTRRTDPYSSNLKFMQKTDPSWPQIIRVSPLLNWSYHQIWSYIIKHNVPYCNLYDQGYTSIGSTQNTQPNPALAYKDSSGCKRYLPAWRLSDPEMERAGRGTVATGLITNGQHSQNGHSHNNGDVL